MNFSNLKLNISERKIGIFLSYMELFEPHNDLTESSSRSLSWGREDRVRVTYSNEYLSNVQEKVTIQEHSIHTRRRSKADKFHKSAQNVDR